MTKEDVHFKLIFFFVAVVTFTPCHGFLFKSMKGGQEIKERNERGKAARHL